MARKIPAWETPFLVRKQAAPKPKPPRNAPGVTDLASAVAWAKAHGHQTAGPYSSPNSDIGDPPVPIGSPASTAPANAAGDPNKPVATPAAPGWQDSTYNNAISGLQGNLKNFGASLTGAGNTLMADYGITGPAFDPYNFDPAKNTPDNFAVDTTNPYSRAALYKKSYDQASSGDGNRMAAQGQLYSGAYQNAQNADTANLNQNNNALLTDFAGQYGGLYGKWLNAQGTEQTGEGDATSAAIGRWTASGAPGPTPTVPQVNAAKQFGQPLANAPYIGLGPVSHTSSSSTPSGKPKPSRNTGALTVVKPKAPKGGKK